MEQKEEMQGRGNHYMSIDEDDLGAEQVGLFFTL